jgi:hypothetical protein
MCQKFPDGCPFCPLCPLDVEIRKIEAIDFKGIFKRKDDQEVVEELFEFTKNPTDWMASQQIEEMIQAKGINFFIIRFRNLATKRNRSMIGCLKDRSKYSGSRVWGFRGVKTRVSYDCVKALFKSANRLYLPHLYIEGTKWTEWTDIREFLAILF